MAMKPIYDLCSGVTRFGLLTIVRDAPYSIHGKAMRRKVVCACGCGVEKEFDAANVKWGKSTSCGCEHVRDPNAPLPPVKKRFRATLEDICGGLRHGLLTVIGEKEKQRINAKSKTRIAICRCDCGNIVERDIQSLSRKTKEPKNCGCVTKKLNRDENKIYVKDIPGYSNWQHMKNRCAPPRNPKTIKPYYEKGITVCDSWKNSFPNFLEDMGHRPSPLHSIDRINPSGNYEPKNCHWVLQKDQARNKIKTVRVRFRGKSMALLSFIEGTLIDRHTATEMAKSGCTGEQIIKAAHEALERLIKS